jgi:hypothetical protein
MMPEPDGVPVAVADWPGQDSPVPRLTLSIADGRMIVRYNEALRQLVLSTAKGPRQFAAA